MGALQSGLTGRSLNAFYQKATIDYVAALIFASSLGVGVLLSAVSILLYQGTITLAHSGFRLFERYDCIADDSGGLSCDDTLALNMMGITKIKVMNMVPAIFLPIILGHFM